MPLKQLARICIFLKIFLKTKISSLKFPMTKQKFANKYTKERAVLKISLKFTRENRAKGNKE